MRSFKAVCFFAVLSAATPCLSQTDGNSESLFSNFIHGQDFSASVQSYYRSSRHQSLSGFNGTEITTLSFHRSAGSNVLHYASTYAFKERHHYAGVSTGPATLAFFQGKGNFFSQTGSALYRDLNHYFFHGGSRLPFRFQGAALGFDLGNKTSTQISAIQLKAPGVEPRHGYYAGVSTGGIKGGIFGLERGNDWVGHGFDFAVGGPHINFTLQQINSETGAQVRRLGFTWRDGPQSHWSMDIEQAHNPLYTDGNEQRIMFRYRRSFGRSMSFNATDEAATEEQEERKKSTEKWATIVGIGVGVGVLVAAVSSGDDDQDNSQRFATQNQAAFNVLDEINPVSVKENREHGGWIYRNLDSSFGHTNPVGGGVASVDIGNPRTAVPSGTQATASYHTHGGPDPRYDNENFSPQDLLSDIQVGVDGYLGTPAGFIKYHEVRTGRVTTLGTIAN